MTDPPVISKVSTPRLFFIVVDANETTTEQPAHGRSRNGTVRNTDSFFKDDTVETKKISLTPNLLRDDASSATYYEQRDVSLYQPTQLVGITDRQFSGCGAWEP